MNIIKNVFKVAGMCVMPDGLVIMATVAIDLVSGLIKEVRAGMDAADLCVPDCLIFAGFVETHVHFRESTDGKANHKETNATGSKAAVNGGLTHACAMGNDVDPPKDEKSYAAKHELTRDALIPITNYATIVPGGRPFTFRGLPVPFKIFMGPSIGITNFESDGDSIDTLQHFGGEDVSSHCESPHVLRLYKHESSHERRRPEIAETICVKLAIRCTRDFRIRTWKVCHVSVEESLRLITAARRLGIPVICEGTHHHVWFNTLMFQFLDDAGRKMLQVNPPIRGPRDQEAILRGLENGDIDILAGDHAPHLWESEKMGPNGMSGLTQADTYGAFVTWLMRERGFTAKRIAEICAINPGRFVNRFLNHQEFGHGYGYINEGYVGSLTILDLNRPATVTKAKLDTKCNWSPFEGITFPGSVRHTVVRGKVYDSIMHD